MPRRPLPGAGDEQDKPQDREFRKGSRSQPPQVLPDEGPGGGRHLPKDKPKPPGTTPLAPEPVRPPFPGAGDDSDKPDTPPPASPTATGRYLPPDEPDLSPVETEPIVIKPSGIDLRAHREREEEASRLLAAGQSEEAQALLDESVAEHDDLFTGIDEGTGQRRVETVAEAETIFEEREAQRSRNAAAVQRLFNREYEAEVADYERARDLEVARWQREELAEYVNDIADRTFFPIAGDRRPDISPDEVEDIIRKIEYGQPLSQSQLDSLYTEIKQNQQQEPATLLWVDRKTDLGRALQSFATIQSLSLASGRLPASRVQQNLKIAEQPKILPVRDASGRTIIEGPPSRTPVEAPPSRGAGTPSTGRSRLPAAPSRPAPTTPAPRPPLTPQQPRPLGQPLGRGGSAQSRPATGGGVRKDTGKQVYPTRPGRSTTPGEAPQAAPRPVRPAEAPAAGVYVDSGPQIEPASASDVNTQPDTTPVMVPDVDTAPLPDVTPRIDTSPVGDDLPAIETDPAFDLERAAEPEGPPVAFPRSTPTTTPRPEPKPEPAASPAPRTVTAPAPAPAPEPEPVQLFSVNTPTAPVERPGEPRVELPPAPPPPNEPVLPDDTLPTRRVATPAVVLPAGGMAARPLEPGEHVEIAQFRQGPNETKEVNLSLGTIKKVDESRSSVPKDAPVTDVRITKLSRRPVRKRRFDVGALVATIGPSGTLTFEEDVGQRGVIRESERLGP